MDDHTFVAQMRASGALLREILSKISQEVKPGGDGVSLDRTAEKMILDAGAKPAFKHYQGFPATLCVSVNDEVVHGIPSHYKFKVGDIVSLDLGLELNGAFTDVATSVMVTNHGNEDIDALLKKDPDDLTDSEKLIIVTRLSLMQGIETVQSGVHIGSIGYAIQQYAEDHHFGVVRQLVGHAVGHAVHEEPSIPNFGKKNTGPLLKDGQTIAIEPMLTLGNWHVTTDDDRWTVRTLDGSLAAHFEHTVLVTNEGYEILT